MEQKPFNRATLTQAEIEEYFPTFKIPQGVDANLIATELLELLDDATNRLGEFIGTDCECDNSHEENNTVCCLCQYRTAIAKAQGKVFVNSY